MGLNIFSFKYILCASSKKRSQRREAREVSLRSELAVSRKIVTIKTFFCKNLICGFHNKCSLFLSLKCFCLCLIGLYQSYDTGVNKLFIFNVIVSIR